MYANTTGVYMYVIILLILKVLQICIDSNGLAENVLTNSHRFLHVVVLLYCAYIDLTQFF